MRISVYVPCRDNETTLAEVLRSLRDQTRPADQYLFINDRCTDRSPAIAAEFGFEVHDQVGKGGLAAGRNRALALADGDVLLGLDADVVAAPDYLEKLEGEFAAQPRISAIGGRLEERHREAPADLWRAVHMPQHHGDLPVVNPRLLFGSTMAVRVAAAREVGGWNERFLTNYEDVDICARLKAAGLHLLYSPGCRAWHLRRDDLDSVMRTFWRWNYFGFEEALKDVPTWLDTRLPIHWTSYQSFRVEDLDYSKLAYITLLFPWAWALRDLAIVRSRDARAGGLVDVAALAERILTTYGYPTETVVNAARWLQELALSLDEGAGAQSPLHPRIASRMRVFALQSIPDLTYGASCSRAIAATLNPGGA
jgi:cellulose synthase/poly-beta-1,6-N-acetylglucosamine synthase-like glycosyltransferase